MLISVFVATPVTAANMLDRKIGDPQLQYALSSVLFPERFTTKDIWFRRVNAKRGAAGEILFLTINTFRRGRY